MLRRSRSERRFASMRCSATAVANYNSQALCAPPHPWRTTIRKHSVLATAVAKLQLASALHSARPWYGYVHGSGHVLSIPKPYHGCARPVEDRPARHTLCARSTMCCAEPIGRHRSAPIAPRGTLCSARSAPLAPRKHSVLRPIRPKRPSQALCAPHSRCELQFASTVCSPTDPTGVVLCGVVLCRVVWGMLCYVLQCCLCCVFVSFV